MSKYKRHSCDIEVEFHSCVDPNLSISIFFSFYVYVYNTCAHFNLYTLFSLFFPLENFIIFNIRKNIQKCRNTNVILAILEAEFHSCVDPNLNISIFFSFYVYMRAF